MAWGFSLARATAVIPSVNLAWDANPEPNTAGYKIHYGTQPTAYTSSVDVGKVTTATLRNLPDSSDYYFAVTAYSAGAQESDFSNEAHYLAVGNVTLAWNNNPEPSVIGYRVHYGTASRTWPKVVNVGKVTTATILNLPTDITHYFVVTAHSSSGTESLPSLEVSTRLPLTGLNDILLESLSTDDPDESAFSPSVVAYDPPPFLIEPKPETDQISRLSIPPDLSNAAETANPGATEALGLRISTANGGVRIEFNLQAGQNYVVKYCDSMSLDHWLPLKSVGPCLQSAPFQVTDNHRPCGQRFYRVKRLIRTSPGSEAAVSVPGAALAGPF